MSTPAPSFTFPSGEKIRVRIINTTAKIKIPLAPFMGPPMTGFTHLHAPAYSFLIEHSSGRKLVFDLGVKKDWENMAARTVEGIKNVGAEVTIEKNVVEILEDNGIKGEDIEAVIWSHWHWDHTGDPSTFPHSTTLIVGPGFKEAFTPGYPEGESSPILASAYEGRTLREISFTEDKPAVQMGSLTALDYFGDGSFYLIDAPGHAIGHMCGLARTSTGPDDFIFMGADFAHHGGQFRPSAYMPIPKAISPNPLELRSSASHTMPCPGHIFEELNDSRGLKGGEPFFQISRVGVAHDAEAADETIEKVQGWDVRGDVFVVFAHDDTLLSVATFFPGEANSWKEAGWAKQAKWMFLKDFGDAIEEGKFFK